MIFFRAGVELERRELSREQSVAFHKARESDLGEGADAKLLADFNAGRAADQQANSFAFGGLQVHRKRS